MQSLVLNLPNNPTEITKMTQRNRYAASLNNGSSDAHPKISSAKEFASLEHGINELLASHKAAAAIKAGEIAPPFRLRDVAGKLVSSDKLLQKGPLVVVFHRGEWCSYCASELAQVQRALPEFSELGASVVAISPQLLSTEDNGMLTRLSDPHNDVAAKFGLRYTLPDDLIALYKQLGVNMPGYNGDESWTLPMSALYVINGEGMVTYSEVHHAYNTHADPRDAIKVLSAQKNRHSE